MRKATRAALRCLLLVAVLAPASSMAAAADQTCSNCHSTTAPSSSYLLTMPTLSASYPAVVPPGTEFNFSLMIAHPGRYTITNPAPRLEVRGGGDLAFGESPSRRLHSIGPEGGARTVTWRLVAGDAPATMLLNASLPFTAEHRHNNGDSNDEKPYVLRKYSTVEVRSVALYATVSELQLPAVAGRIALLEVVSCAELKNVTLTASPNLAAAVSADPATIGALAPGQRQTVRLTVGGGARVVDNGRLDIVWENLTGAKNLTFVMVRTWSPAGGPAATDPVRWMGRFTGLLSLCLLVSSVVLGYVRRGGQRRVRAHCAVSWFILGLSVYHGLALALFPYNRVWLGNWVVLGYGSASVMGFSSVNGLLQRWWTKRLGRQNWLWLHRISLVAAIALVVVHALMIGTDFRFLHGSGGEGRGGD